MGKHINLEIVKKREQEANEKRKNEAEIKELKQKLEDEQEKNIVLEQQVLEVQNYILNQEYEKLLNQGGVTNDI